MNEGMKEYSVKSNRKTRKTKRFAQSFFIGESRFETRASRIENQESGIESRESGFEIRESGVNIGINGDSGEHRLPLDCEQGGRCEQDDHRALDVDHDALDEDHDHHELDALALHNPLVSPSTPQH